MKLLRNRAEVFAPPPRSTLYCYGEYSKQVPHIESMGVQTHFGPPDDALIEKLNKPALVILDDLLFNLDERWLNEQFTKKSHHNNFAVVLVTQNLFDKIVKVPRLNSMYIFLMRAPNSLLSIRNLGTMLFPRELTFFLDAYKQATKSQYGYLLIDLHPSTNPLLKLQTNVFPNEERVIFIPK